LISYSQAATAPKTFSSGALASAKCRGVSNTSIPTSSTLCTKCFAWNTDARAIDYTATANNCATKLTNGVTDCEFYFTETSNTNSLLFPTASTCMRCKKTYANYIRASASGIATLTCSSSKGSGCTGTVENSLQTACIARWSTVDNALVSSQCAFTCNEGYIPAENDVWDYGFLKCVKGTPPTPNCRWLMFSTNQWSTPLCQGCTKNFARISNYACVGYTTDENCKDVNTADEGCIQCWFAYYFSGTTCTLYSQFLVLQFICLLGLLAFFY